MNALRILFLGTFMLMSTCAGFETQSFEIVKKVYYMNVALMADDSVLAINPSRSYLDCIHQCRSTKGCHAGVYKDKRCTKAKVPSPQVTSVRQDGLDKAFSDISIDIGSAGDFGWIVFQKRLDGTTDFYRGWQDYVNGFGNLNNNFWMGLENIHQLRNAAGGAELHVYMDTFEGEEFYAHYGHFAVGGSETGYLLSVGGYSGTAGDSMAWHNNTKFSTCDNDQDTYTGNCAIRFKGAWWYTDCHKSNLNGQYLGGGHSTFADGMNWKSAKSYYYSMKTTIMKIRMKSL